MSRRKIKKKISKKQEQIVKIEPTEPSKVRRFTRKLSKMYYASRDALRQSGQALKESAEEKKEIREQFVKADKEAGRLAEAIRKANIRLDIMDLAKQLEQLAKEI